MTDDHKALVARLRLLGDRATYEPHAHHQAADAIEALTAQLAEAEARHEREVEAASVRAWKAGLETAACIAERRIAAGRAESVAESIRVQTQIGAPEDDPAAIVAAVREGE